jgi:hypothetical protein
MLRKIFLGCALTFFVLAVAVAAGAYASLASVGPRMGPQITITRRCGRRRS